MPVSKHFWAACLCLALYRKRLIVTWTGLAWCDAVLLGTPSSPALADSLPPRVRPPLNLDAHWTCGWTWRQGRGIITHIKAGVLMAFRIPSDVFIWLCYYKPSTFSPPQQPPPTPMMTCWPLLTLAYHPCLCAHVFVSVIDWYFVCVVCVPHFLSACAPTCMCVLPYHDFWGHTSARRVTKQYMLSRVDGWRKTSVRPKLLFYKMLRHLDDRHDSQLCLRLHMWQSGAWAHYQFKVLSGSTDVKDRFFFVGEGWISFSFFFSFPMYLLPLFFLM